MKSIKVSDIERILVNSTSTGDVQTRCREIFVSQFEKDDFPDSRTYNLICKLGEFIGFPIDYVLKTKKVDTANKESSFQPIIWGCLGLSSFFMPKIIDTLLALTAGAGLGYYIMKKNQPKKERSYISVNTSAKEIMVYMVQLGELLVNFSKSDSLVKDSFHMLTWLRDLYVSSKKQGNVDLMEDIEMLLLKNGYKFVDYSEDIANCFHATKALTSDIKDHKTTHPAVMNINSKHFVIYGQVVFPQ